MHVYRSSRLEVLCKKGLLKNLAKLVGKHLCQSSFLTFFFNFFKKEPLAHVFSIEFCEIFKNTFFIEHIWWLLLCLYKYAVIAKIQCSEPASILIPRLLDVFPDSFSRKSVFNKDEKNISEFSAEKIPE